MKTPFLRFLPAALLIGVAGLQLHTARVSGLTPWKGGGFGMFSTVDSGNSRFLRAYALTADGAEPIELPSRRDIRELSRKTRMLASEASLSSLAQRLAETRSAGPIQAPASGGAATGAVRLELWRYEFERATQRLVARRFMSVVATRWLAPDGAGAST